jgi:T5orf172 domain-containing protein
MRRSSVRNAVPAGRRYLYPCYGRVNRANSQGVRWGVPVDPRDPASVRTLSRARCFVYVAPCAHEDLLKLGHSRDPLRRFQSLHRRWFEFFAPERIALVEADTVREARAIELALKHRLADWNAPVPLTVAREAGGHGEWYRGASAQLERAVSDLERQGHRVHVPALAWLRDALQARSDLLYAWTESALSVDELELRAGTTPAQRIVRDVLDAYPALGIPLEEHLPPSAWRWYEAGGGLL